MPEIGIPLTQPVYGAHNPRWSCAPDSGEGARRFGGRFNRPGQPALYTSLDPATAIREASRLGAPLQPVTLCEYRVDCHRILEATDPARCADEGVTEAMLECPAWRDEMLAGRVPASQALADRLIARGYCGMIVRSFAVGSGAHDLNVVFWRWSEQPPAMVCVVDDEGRLRRPPG